MSSYRALAPAKINLALFVGPTRDLDGRHELATVMQSISLADELTLEEGDTDTSEDEVVCPGVPGPPGENLAALALRAFRAATGWQAGPVRLRIRKQIPLAAGLGGGSADAAATLRLAGRASGLGDEMLLRELAPSLGADVPSQVSPGRWLATGAGERLERLPYAALGVLVLPASAGLSTAEVYSQADRLQVGRSPHELAERTAQLRAALASGSPLPAPGLLHNDLQAAALSLCPEIAHRLALAAAAGADAALVSGSGPTVVGLFAGGRPDPPRLPPGGDGRPAAVWTRAVGAARGRVVAL